MIVLSQEQVVDLLEAWGPEHPIPLDFTAVDDGDVYLSSHLSGRSPNASGLLVVGHAKDVEESSWQLANVDVVVIAQPGGDVARPYRDFTCRGLVRRGQQFTENEVLLIPIREQLFSRVQGMYETDVLKEKTVLLIGVGSGGGMAAVELAKAGVGRFLLVDHDRLELVNIVRHVCGTRDLGRFKTKALRDLIHEKNPFAVVETFEAECNNDWVPTLRHLVRQANLVYCGTDNRPSRVLINRICLEENRVCIYAGTFSRAYGGHVLRVIPQQSMCYQCLIDLLPELALNQEITSETQATQFQYADETDYRPVAVEPGLATDIAPMVLMSVKIGILELLRGSETTLASLYDDLRSAWYQWLNRREVGTDYEQLKPLDSGEDDYRILAWYGVLNERNPSCPACGDFVGIELGPVSEEEVARFAATGKEEDKTEGKAFPPMA